MAIDIPAALGKLATLGYLPAGIRTMDATATRAVKRFQRHARRMYRMPSPDESASGIYTGQISGVLDVATVAQIDRWITRGWRLPLSRFPLVTLSAGGRLRSDAAQAWERIVSIVTASGGTLQGPYGDTTRPVRPNTKVGASRYSFHYSGRAVDINQELGNRNARQRYFITKESSGGDTYWRIYCKTLNQDGTQGTQFTKGQVRCYDFSQWTEYDLPAGNYVDLTNLIESTMAFERIKAQSAWQGVYNKTEWWHFQYKVDKQETFSDEMELIGYTESQLRTAGWGTDADLDRKPG